MAIDIIHQALGETDDELKARVMERLSRPPGTTVADLASMAMESNPYAVRSAIAGQLDGPNYRVLVLPHRYREEDISQIVGDAQSFINDHIPFVTTRVEVKPWR